MSKKPKHDIDAIRKEFLSKATYDQMFIFTQLNVKLSEEYNKQFGGDYEWDNIPFRKRTFKGWLRPLVILSDCMLHGRWTYWLEINASMKVANKPIPKLNFLTHGDSKFDIAADMIKECLNPPNMQKYGPYKTFLLFIDWLLWGFGSNLVKEFPHIDNELNEYWYRTFKADLMLMFPADYFVAIASELYSNSTFNSNAFFPTPSHVVDMMTRMIFSSNDPKEIEAYKYQAVNEPCCGSGVMILYSSNYSLRIYAQDIDELMIKICTINCYLYAPWVVEMSDEMSNLLQLEHKKYSKEVK